MKTQTLFPLAPTGRKTDRAQRITVKQRKFSVMHGQLYTLVTELDTERSFWEGKLKAFQMLTEELERGKGADYNIRAAIIRRLS